MVKIETIIFDLSEVYVQGIKGVEFEIARVLDLNKDYVRNILRGEKTQQLFRGEMSEEQYWNGIISENNFPRRVDGYGSTADFLKSVVRENFREIPGTREVIENLNKEGYQLVMLSDNASEWAKDCMERYPLQKLFSVLNWSFEEGVTKKDPEIYVRALDRAGAMGDTTLFIDNNSRNFPPARDAGIRYTVRFDSAPSLNKDLWAAGCYKCKTIETREY